MMNIFSNILGILAKLLRVYFFISVRGSIGDTLCMTALFPFVPEGFSIFVISNRPEIFHKNPYVRKHIDVSFLYRFSLFVRKPIIWFLMNLDHQCILSYRFKSGAINGNYLRSLRDWDLHGQGHLILAHLHGRSVELDIPADVSQILPNIYVDRFEASMLKEQYDLPEKFIVAFSSSKTDVTRNKNINFKHLRDFWTALANDYAVVQLGMIDDPLIPSALDLRGKTGLREVFGVVSLCCGVVAPEGFPNHVGASLGKFTFVLSTGYTRRKYYQYDGITKFFSPSEHRMECLPCWKSTDCPFDLACVNIPSSDDMINEIKKII